MQDASRVVDADTDPPYCLSPCPPPSSLQSLRFNSGFSGGNHYDDGDDDVMLVAVLVLDGDLGLQELWAVGDRAGDPGRHETKRPGARQALSQRRDSRLRFRRKVCICLIGQHKKIASKSTKGAMNTA